MTQMVAKRSVRPGPGRPREFDMETVLERAIDVFSGRGYHGTSVADLAAATGLAWGSIYKAFGDKHSLFLAAFDHYASTRLSLLRERVGCGSGRDRLRQALLFYVEASQGETGRRGCLSVTVTGYERLSSPPSKLFWILSAPARRMDQSVGTSIPKAVAVSCSAS